MQGALIIFAALIAFACAQTVPAGGCCFYADKEYKNEVACTSSTFTIAELTFPTKASFKGIQSFFCEDGWSAAIVNNGEAQELVDCGDTVPETTVPIPTTQVTIGPCLQRRCCFYSGKNKDGNEYCMYAGASVEAELKNAQSEPFLVGECLQEWKAELSGKNGKVNVDCGVTLDLDGKNTFDKITLTACTAPKAVSDEVVADTLGEEAFVDTFQADQAVADVAVEEDALVDNFAADQAAADLAVADENVDMFSTDLLADASLDQAVADVANVDDASFAVADVAVADDALLALDHVDGSDDFAAADQAVADFSEDDLFVGDYNDQAVMDAFDEQFVDNFADQAVGDNFDQVFGDQEFDAAVQDSTNTMNSSANSVFVTLAVVVASLVALLF